MLIFKQNIYEKRDAFRVSEGPALGHQEWFNAYHFVRNSISDDLEFFDMLQRSPGQILEEDLSSFFPHACRFGKTEIIKSLLNILWKGLEDPEIWYRMNTYHFCLLYDSMFRQAFNYNHDSREEKLKAYPEMKGKPIQFNLVVRDYFFNTVFLLGEDRYNALTGEDKKQLGYTCPCQFGVIYGLAPNPDEMELKAEHSFPYTIYV